MDRHLKLAFVLAVLVAVWPTMVRAAEPTLNVVVPDEYLRTDEIVPVVLSLDTVGRNMNAVDVTIAYSTVGLDVVRVDRNMAAFSLWPTEPTWDNDRGRLHFAAGRPNGFIAAGATVATIYLRPRIPGLWQIAVADSTRAYLNDGRGTAVVLSGARRDLSVVDPLVSGEELMSATHPRANTWYRRSEVTISWPIRPGYQYSYRWSNVPTDVPGDIPRETAGLFQVSDVADGVWWFTIKSRGPDGIWGRVTRRTVLIDATAPAPFTVNSLTGVNRRDPVIAWVATDAGSGVTETRLVVGGRDYGPVRSPFTVQTRFAGQKLVLRAIDGAGNETEATWRDPRPVILGWWQFVAIGTAIVVLGVALGLLWHHRQRRRS